MNNYSAEAPINDTIDFLESIINKANSYVSIKNKEHEALFIEAKKYVEEYVKDDDRLLLSIRNHVPYTWSAFEHWKNAGVWHQLWNNPPDDDIEEHKKKCEQQALVDAREGITIMLSDMYDLSLFFDTTIVTFRLGGGGDYYPIGYKFSMQLLADNLPNDLRQTQGELNVYNKKIRKLQQMCDSLAVYEFETVIIEENMLEIIEAVKKNIV